MIIICCSQAHQPTSYNMNLQIFLKEKTFHWHLSVNSVVFSKTFQKHFSKTFHQPVSSRVVFSKPAGSSLSPRQCCQSKHDQLIRHHHAVNQNMIENCLHLPSCFSPSSCSLLVVVTWSPPSPECRKSISSCESPPPPLFFKGQH